MRTYFACARTSRGVSTLLIRSASSLRSCGRPSERGTSVSARTRRACARPSVRRRTPARACARRGPRSCGPPSPGRSWTCGTRCGSSASRSSRSSTRCGSSAAPRRKAPSLSSCSTLLLPAPAGTDDQLVGLLVLAARALAERGHAPRCDGMAPAFRLALAATVRVVDRVHRGTAHGRALALPARAACLAARDVLVVHVTDLPDRGAKRQRHAAHL